MWDKNQIEPINKLSWLNSNQDSLDWKVQTAQINTNQEVIQKLYFSNFNAVISSILWKVTDPAKEINRLKEARAADDYYNKENSRKAA